MYKTLSSDSLRYLEYKRGRLETACIHELLPQKPILSSRLIRYKVIFPWLRSTDRSIARIALIAWIALIAHKSHTDGTKIANKMHTKYIQIAQDLYRDSTWIEHGLHTNCTKFGKIWTQIVHGLHTDCTYIAQWLLKDCKQISQFHTCFSHIEHGLHIN